MNGGERLLSVGIDIGTSTTQLVLSRLTLKNRAGAFSVPKIAIEGREILYRSAVHRTPLKDERTIDGDGIRDIVAAEYEKAGMDRRDIQTGAVIITGETARKENARGVLEKLAGFAGDFVVATAGPDLESVLAARGAGADRMSEETGKTVLHCDIGGGTSNFALYEKGALKSTGCLDVGGRLILVDEGGKVRFATEKLRPFVTVGGDPLPGVEAMAEALLQASGQKPETDLLRHFITHKTVTLTRKPDILSFSGGVADCMREPSREDFPYGDVGPLLGKTLREKLARCGAELRWGEETIRATVVGAGAYSVEVSGSTVFYRGVTFPLKNLPVIALTEEQERSGTAEFIRAVREQLSWLSAGEEPVQAALCLHGERAPTYERVQKCAEQILEGLLPMRKAGHFPVVLLREDMAKALGQAMARKNPGPLLVLDGIAAGLGDYVDIAAPAAGGLVLPVVVKTLAFEEGKGAEKGERG